MRHTIRLSATAMMCATFWIAVAGCAAEQKPLQEFRIQDHFGVSHPIQIIDFDLTPDAQAALAGGKAGSFALTSPEGIEVPYQIIDGARKLALRTGLPAGEILSWRLLPGRPAAPVAEPVVVTEDARAGIIEIANGLTGVRVPVRGAVEGAMPPPVLALRMRSGAWLPADHFQSLRIKSMGTKLLERGPLLTRVAVSYRFEPAEGGDPEAAPGELYYTCTIQLEAGQPAVVFEEESNTDVSYEIKLDSLKATHGRYRGHHSSSVEWGREADGRQYRPWHERAGIDAFVDLSFSKPIAYPKFDAWNPWCVDTGWYWQIYDDKAPENADFVGLFAGAASRAWCPAGGVQLTTSPGAVQDLATAASDDTIHAVYQSGNDLWYIGFDRQLAASKPVKIAERLENPDVAVAQNGTVLVMAHDPAARGFVLIEITPGGISKSGPVVLEGLDGVAISDPFPHQATRNDDHLLFFCGSIGGEQRGLLYCRKLNEGAFLHRSTLDNIRSERQIERACFEALFDGSVRVIATDRGGYALQATIAPEASVLSGVQAYAGRPLNFGAALDPMSGTAVICDYPEGNLREYGLLADAQAAPLRLQADHHGQGANRRTLATAPDGTAVLLFGGSTNNEFRHGAYQKSKGKWSRWLDADQLDMAAARVHYHEPTGQFVFVGRKDGMLTLHGCKPGATVLAELQRFPETRIDTASVRVFCVQNPRIQPEHGRFTRFQWGLFAGVRSELAPTDQTQPIQRLANLHQGINLNKIHRLILDFPDPPQGYGSIYMRPDALEPVIEKLRADREGPHGNGYYGNLFRSDPGARDLITMWADASGERITEVTKRIASLATELLNSHVNGEGIHEIRYHYWHGGLAMGGTMLWIDQVLASDQASAEQKAEAKAAAVLFASLLWDNDLVPMDNCYGINLGTPNMPVQQSGFRNMYALLLSRHPMMKNRLDIPVARTADILRNDIHESGAHMASVHYIGAGMGPTLSMAQQLQMVGVKDLFKEEPKLAKFAEFYLQCSTPPDPRFGGLRKTICIGDGSTESTEFCGQLATGFAATNPELSKRLMSMWRAQGRVHSSFHGTTLLKIDERLPDAPAKLASAHFEGYFSVLRAAFGTPSESAVWFVNGSHYRDHGHDDQGSVSVYLLGAPLSADWGPIYYPRTAGAIYHSSALPESALDHPWDKDGPQFNAGTWSGYSGVKARLDGFQAMPEGGWSGSAMTAPDGKFTWSRAVTLAQTSQDLAVLAIQDAYTGEGAAGAKIFTLNLMAEGDVETPGGKVTPVERIYGYENRHGDRKELASSGQVLVLKPGVSRLGFAGQSWKGHPTEGIDFDVFVLADGDQQAHIGNWAHAWNPGREIGEFQEAQGRPFEERQHILRIRSQTGFRVAVVAWPKGKRPQNLAVTTEGEDIVVTANGQRLRIAPEGTVAAR